MACRECQDLLSLPPPTERAETFTGPQDLKLTASCWPVNRFRGTIQALGLAQPWALAVIETDSTSRSAKEAGPGTLRL